MDPGITPGRSTTWARPVREPVEIELDTDSAEIDIVYVDQACRRSRRRIKPEALRVLRAGEIALVAMCRLRGERRSFAFAQIESATLPGMSGSRVPGDRLIELFAADIERLVAHDATINGAVIRPARRAPAPAECVACDIQIDEEVIDPAAAGPQARGEAVLLERLCGQITDFSDAVLAEGAHGRMGVTTTLRMEDGAARIYVDVPTWVASAVQDGSAHARIAYMNRKRGIARDAEAFLRRLVDAPHIGHDALTVRLVMTRAQARESAAFWLAIDGAWINVNPNAPGTIGAKIRRAARRMEAMPACDPLTGGAPNWMIETTEGVYRARGATPRAAASRLAALLGRDRIRVLGVAQMVGAECPATDDVHAA